MEFLLFLEVSVFSGFAELHDAAETAKSATAETAMIFDLISFIFLIPFFMYMNAFLRQKTASVGFNYNITEKIVQVK